MANFVQKRGKYQYYDGRAFMTPDNKYDYSWRNAAMKKNLNAAKSYLIEKGKSNNIPTLDKGFVQKIYEQAKDSYKTESYLYKSLKKPNNFLELPVLDFSNSNETLSSVEQYLAKSKDEINSLMKNFLPNKNSNKLCFISMLQDKDFMTYLSNHTTTLSFEAMGKKLSNGTAEGDAARKIAKKSYATQLTGLLIQKNDKNRQKYLDELIQIIFDDIRDNYAEQIQIDFDSEAFGAELRDMIQASIEQSLQAFVKAQLKGNIPSTMEKRFKKIMSGSLKGKGTDNIKRFYKRIYDSIVQELQKRYQIEKQGLFLQGTLHYYGDFSDTVWGSEITAKIYERGTNTQWGSNLNLNKETIVKFLLDLLEESFPTVRKDGRSARALKYLQSNRTEIERVFLNSVQAMPDKKFQRWVAAFSKSGVSGFLGEFAAVLTLGESFIPTIVGADTNDDGKQLPVDIRISVIDENGEIIYLGIQVKNYTASSNKISLYTGTEVKLASTGLESYLSKKDVKLLRFLMANEKLMKKKFGEDIPESAYIDFLNGFTLDFLRGGEQYDKKLRKRYKNNFYYIKNKIIPTSYILMTIIKNALKTIQKAKNNSIKNNVFSIENIQILDYAKIEQDAQVEEYQMDKNGDQRVNKIVNGNKYSNAYPFSLGLGNNQYYPLDVNTNANLIFGNTKIVFKGIKIDIDF